MVLKCDETVTEIKTIDEARAFNKNQADKHYRLYQKKVEDYKQRIKELEEKIRAKEDEEYRERFKVREINLWRESYDYPQAVQDALSNIQKVGRACNDFVIMYNDRWYRMEQRSPVPSDETTYLKLIDVKTGQIKEIR